MRIFLLQAEKKFNCNVETKLICEYCLPCRLFFLLRFFIIYFFFCQNKGGAGPPSLDPPLVSVGVLHRYERRLSHTTKVVLFVSLTAAIQR